MNAINPGTAIASRLFRFIICAACGAVVTPASAGQFTVTPVRMFMTPQDRAIAVTVVNEADEPLVMQADIFTWKQKPNGEDDLVLTEDLILSPPIIKLGPKSRQVVRLARVKPVQSAEQLTYRMVVRELPQPRPASKDVQLQIALAFSLPVFITPPTAKRALTCVVERIAPTAVRAVCENKGNAYAQLRELTLTGPADAKIAGAETGLYILPDIKRGFEIKRADGRIPGGAAKLTVTLDDASTQSFDVTIPE